MHLQFWCMLRNAKGIFTPNTTKSKMYFKSFFVQIYYCINCTEPVIYEFILRSWIRELCECNSFKTYYQKDTVYILFLVFPLIFQVTRQSGEVCYCSLQFKCIHFLITVSNWLFCSIPITHRKAVSKSLAGKTHLIQVSQSTFLTLPL